MDCRTCEELLPSYLGEELDDIRRKKIQDHLRKCSSCRTALEREQSVDLLLETLHLNLPPIDISRNVMEAIADREAVKNPHRQFLSVFQDVFAAAAAAIILFSGLNFAAADLKAPDYSSAINSLSGRAGNLTSVYVRVSSDVVNNLFTTIEGAKLFKGDE